jgi:hypothetical protein
MSTDDTTTSMKDRKAIFSALWIFAVFNYLYADFVIMMVNPSLYQNMVAGMSEWVILGLAVLMEIPIAMVLLSRVLKYRANRWANIIAGIQSTAFVAFTLIGGRPAPFYLFFAALEIACTLFIIWYAWTWKPATASAVAS